MIHVAEGGTNRAIRVKAGQQPSSIGSEGEFAGRNVGPENGEIAGVGAPAWTLRLTRPHQRVRASLASNASRTARPTSVVLAWPPKSGVRGPGVDNTLATAARILSPPCL